VHGDQLDGDPIVETARILAEGRVVAVKGIGGFHLACDALSEEAVQILRERKGREEKPFAVMMPDLTTVKRYCEVSPLEKELLSSPVSPIVLLSTHGERVATNVAPFIGTLGVMLPYSPVHHLLFRHPGIPPEKRPRVLVMTSGNRAEEPIARGNREAIERLGDLADAFLLHNREIELRADDSIFRVIRGRPTVFRRSRGIVPGDFRVEAVYSSAQSDFGLSEQTEDGTGSLQLEGGPVVLAAGGDLKNVPAIIKGDRAVPGPHIGDLASPVAQDYFKQSVSVLTWYLEANPDIIAVDPHPEYFSNSLAREIKVKVVEVFHHHAHAVSLLFEHGLRGPAIFAVFDGTGYGKDGTIWGGEFLVADCESFTREAHLGLYNLPGGEAAIREPMRILAALLAVDGALPEEFHPLMGPYLDRVKVWLEAVRKGINSPVTSSAGRLFDATAAAIGFSRRVTFEGEAAMWLEGVADPAETGEYEIHTSGDKPIAVDPSALIVSVARDMLHNSTRAIVAARFHNSMARMIACVVSKLALKTGIDTIGLTGGCFQNKLLTEKAASLLEEKGFRVLLHEAVPPNDGGIALGQAICARARL
jgi:hydrogenase maturation protein HypF